MTYFLLVLIVGFAISVAVGYLIAGWSARRASIGDARAALSVAVQDNTRALLNLKTQEAANRKLMYDASQVQYGALVKAVAMAANGSIGGRAGLGFQAPSPAGSTRTLRVEVTGDATRMKRAVRPEPWWARLGGRLMALYALAHARR